MTFLMDSKKEKEKEKQRARPKPRCKQIGFHSIQVQQDRTTGWANERSISQALGAS
jgi:hypothetical protein